MKKLLILSIVSFLAKATIANPLPGPEIYLNKVIFDSTGNWTIELYYKSFDVPLDQYCDSLWIGNKTEISCLKNIKKPSGSGFIIITKDSLKNDLKINPKRDIISLGINGYERDNIYIDTTASNGYSNISALRAGQSISYTGNFWGIYSKSKCRNLGLFKDTCGVFGTLKGNIYDINNNIVINRNFRFASINGTEFEITINPNGSYQGKLFSSIYGKGYYDLLYCIDTNCYSCDFEPISLDNVEPDTIIFRDIYLLDTLKSLINTQKIEQEDIFKLYPNKIINSSNIHYEISIPVISSNCYLYLLNLNGQIIEKYRIVNNKGNINLPEEVKSGQYFISLILNNKKIASHKILIE